MTRRYLSVYRLIEIPTETIPPSTLIDPPLILNQLCETAIVIEAETDADALAAVARLDPTLHCQALRPG